MRKEVIVDRFKTRWQDYYGSLIQGELKPLNRNGEFRGLCPLHDDRNPSLTINQNTGFWKCFGCDFGGDAFDFWAKLKGLSTTANFKEILTGIADHFSLNGREPERPKKRIDRAYSYTNDAGKLLFQTVRYDPKDFRQRQPDVKGGWTWSLKDVRLVPYQLPRLVKAQEVLIVEGEKDVENLIRLGFCATTFPMGAGKWRTEYSAWFKEKDCILIPDNDQQGREHMNTIARSLQGTAASIKLLNLPDLPEKGDVSDWIAKQTDREAAFERLSIMIENANSWTSESLTESNLATGFNQTDMGNSERLVVRHGKEIRYCYPWGKWLVWDDRRWVIDDSGGLERKAKETVRTIAKEITVDMNTDQVQHIYDHAKRSESDGRIQAMAKLARSEVPVMPGDLDCGPYLLNVLNGTIDLKAGKLLPHKRENFTTKMAPVEYEPGAECSMWMKFLDRIMDGNTHLIEFLQRVVGYSLTGDMAEQCFLILYGIGANGKTTFLETIRAMLGDYAQQADFKTFLTSRNDSGISNDIAALKGARFVSACEAGPGRSLNEALIKQLTGGEPIRARFLYGEFFEFHPTFKIFLATNHKPRIRNQDLGIWRRVRLVPFDVVIPKEEQDPRLIEKLRDESSGILNWALKGCEKWRSEGLGEPEEVSTATNEYRASEDALGGFIEDKCVLSPAARIKTGDLKKAYKEWCETNEEKPVYQNTFAALLEGRGCVPGRDCQGRYWEGIELKTSMS